MVRRFATDVELPNSSPPGDNYAASKKYVDDRALPPGGSTGQFLKKDSGTDLDVVWGGITADMLPKAMYGVGTVTVVGGQNIAIDADQESYPMIYKITMTTSATANQILIPTGVSFIGQVIKFHCYASGGDRAINFQTGYRKSTGIENLSFDVPSGEVLIAAIEFDDQIDDWVLTAATVSAA